MVAARVALGQSRQLFFVQQGGFDFHDNLLTDQANLLRQVADAMAAFPAAMVALGTGGSVTTFTTSEFGRALQGNGRSSDHGWGSHHRVMDGAVLGNRVYGSFPRVAIGGPEDFGQGRLIPTTAVDEYGATLARWFGVPDAQLRPVLPNPPRFARSNLGFLGWPRRSRYAAKFASEVLAPIDAQRDLRSCTWKDGVVTTADAAAGAAPWLEWCGPWSLAG